MESEFEKNLQNIQPKGISPEEKNMLWSNITESIKAETFIKAHKSTTSHFFNMFNGFKRVRFVVSAIVAGALLMGSFATVAYADNSRPGDLLFPLDLAVENIQLRLAAADGEDELRIQFASERLEEVKELLALANIDFEVFVAAAEAEAAKASTTASTTDSTATSTSDTDTTTDQTTSTTTNPTTATSTDEVATTTTEETTVGDDEEDEDETLEYDASALNKANNAFLVALEYLKNSKAELLSDGNTSAVIVIDSFIEELTFLADHHVNDIEKSRIVVNDGPNNKEKVSIAIRTSIDDVKTEFNYDTTTRSDGSSSAKIALDDGVNELQLNVSRESDTQDDDSNYGSDYDDDDDYDDDFYGRYKERKIDVCYKNDSKEVAYDEIGKYMKKGAKLGDCDDNNDKKLYICHKGKTLKVASAAKKAHLAHGDYVGKCSDSDDDDDVKYYICYEGNTKYVDLEDKNKYLEKGAINGKCSDSQSVSVPDCSLATDVDGRTIYDFGGDMIRSDKSKSDSYTSHKSVFLDEGKYKVTLMSYDGYVGRENDSQPNESWHITFWDKSENDFVETSNVSDIPDNFREKTVIEVVDDGFEYDGKADVLYAEHAVYPDTSSSNSVKVICAAFDKIEEAGDETAPVISDIAHDAGQTSANISWKTDENATSKVWYSTSNTALAESPTDFVSSGSLKTSHLLTLNGLSSLTTYYFFVESADAEGNKAVSPRQSFATDDVPDTTAPLFTGIVVNASTTEATVAWTTNENTTGEIFYSLVSPVETSSNSVKSPNLATAHGKTLSPLDDNTTYYYMIVIEDDSGNVSTSSESSFKTVEIPEVDETAPVVSGLTKEATTTEATIEFSTNEDARSEIWYSTITPVPIGAPSMDLSLRQSHSYTLTSLQPETTYYFLIETEDSQGNSSMESEDTFTTTPVPIPVDVVAPEITSLSVSAASTTADVTFETSEAATTVFYYAEAASIDTETASSMSDGLLASHAYSLSGLATSTTYYYLVTATDEAGNTSTSSEESFSTL